MKKITLIALLFTACKSTTIMYQPMLVTAVRPNGKPELHVTGTPTPAIFHVGDTVKLLFHKRNNR